MTPCKSYKLYSKASLSALFKVSGTDENKGLILLCVS